MIIIFPIKHIITCCPCVFEEGEIEFDALELTWHDRVQWNG